MKMNDVNTTPEQQLLEAAQAFSALGSEQRLEVLRSLVRAGPEGLRMGELSDRTGIAGSTLTHHLRILRQSGLVGQSRRGREIICVAAAFETVERLSQFLLNECCADVASSPNDHCPKDEPHD